MLRKKKIHECIWEENNLEKKGNKDNGRSKNVEYIYKELERQNKHVFFFKFGWLSSSSWIWSSLDISVIYTKINKWIKNEKEYICQKKKYTQKNFQNC